MSAADQILTSHEINALWPRSQRGFLPVRIREEDVPENLRVLIPYAEVWGVSDDGYRLDLIKKTPPTLLANLKNVVSRFDDQLEGWLAGSEADGPDFTDAYIAFSSLVMAMDFIA